MAFEWDNAALDEEDTAVADIKEQTEWTRHCYHILYSSVYSVPELYFEFSDHSTVSP